MIYIHYTIAYSINIQTRNIACIFILSDHFSLFKHFTNMQSCLFSNNFCLLKCYSILTSIYEQGRNTSFLSSIPFGRCFIKCHTYRFCHSHFFGPERQGIRENRLLIKHMLYRIKLRFYQTLCNNRISKFQIFLLKLRYKMLSFFQVNSSCLYTFRDSNKRSLQYREIIDSVDIDSWGI